MIASSVLALLGCSSDDDASDNAPEVPEVPGPGDDTPNGLSVPAGFKDWRVVGVANPGGDNSTIRVVVGNDIAVEAARSGQTLPWPEGTMLADYVWADGTNPSWEAVVAPGDFAALTFSVKDSVRYAADGGWAYGRWAGKDLVPAAAGFDRACVNCHVERVSDNDFVFTLPGQLPAQAAVAAAAPAANGLAIPTDIRDWRVVSVAHRTDSNTIRVIVGNDVAVAAARAGQTLPWPNGSMLAHYSWAAGENAFDPATVAPGAFAQLTVMLRDDARFAADGNWQFGVWNGLDLAAPADPAFDRPCVNCHVERVSDNDFVFTRPGALP